MRALRFLVFFDIRDEAIGQSSPPHQAYETGRQRALPSEYGSPVTLVFEHTYLFPFLEPMPKAPSGEHHDPGFTEGKLPDDEELEGAATDIAGATVPVGTPDDGVEASPQRATVAFGQLFVRMFLARPHSLGSMDNFHRAFTATHDVT